MKTSIRNHRSRGFTLIELLVVISIIAIIAALAMPAFTDIMLKARMDDQLSNGRQIYATMRNYASETAHAGAFPTYKDPDDANTIVSSSNEAFEILLPRYVDNKVIFGNRHSPWTKPVPKSESTAKKVMPGECDWAYVRGLRDTSDSRWPILANAFSPGSTTYVADPGQKGGAWKGTRAVVIYAGGNAEIANTIERGQSYFIKRADKPSANAFEKDGEWLSGDEVEVLHPKS